MSGVVDSRMEWVKGENDREECRDGGWITIADVERCE